MTTEKYSEIDVDELMQKIKEDVAHRKHSVSYPIQSSSLTIGTALRLSHIETLLNAATEKSQPRRDLPTKLNRFPLNLSRRLQRFCLRVYHFLFKEQRAVNLSIIYAMRESLVLNHQLAQQIIDLQKQLNDVQRQATALEERLEEPHKHPILAEYDSH
ncbi:MAG: hypothetical protein KME13_06505 [Myxacorys californica WJT36-NPBG1]|jgi:O-antigen chain-terminating methyltransferase|nr:hypothetical protein [Myxacorys californica WJT36-NPBG1]